MTRPSRFAELDEATWGDYPTISLARKLSRESIADLAAGLAEVTLPNGVFIGVLGSLGRLEATEGSDVDFGVYATRHFSGVRVDLEEVVKHCKEVLAAKNHVEPNETGHFADPVNLQQQSIDLIGRQGLEGDSNAALTHRMLLLCESRAILGDAAWRDGLSQIRSTYLAHHENADRPPRFLLNDVTRYWRTLCVDFQGKMIERGSKGWGIRNAKLRMSRKLLFVGGVLPLYLTVGLEGSDLDDALAEWYEAVPLERLVAACHALDSGALVPDLLGAYDEFLGMLHTEREALEAVEKDNRSTHAIWIRVQDMERRFQVALETLFFKTDIQADVRRYALF